mgnify:CR=1 FL=1
MRLTFISDTHGKHLELTDSILGSGDILIHCGDVSTIGTFDEITNFLDWFSKTNFTHKIFIAGNHDFWFTKTHNISENYADDNVTYLFDSSVIINGIKFYGSPWQPKFHNWAFNMDRNSDDLNNVWSKIPYDTDVLITHTPPYGILDIVNQSRVGCELLFDHVKKINPIIHVFGHIHGSYGQRSTNNTEYINASCLDDNYFFKNKPITVDLDTTTKKFSYIY